LLITFQIIEAEILMPHHAQLKFITKFGGAKLIN